MGHLGYVIYCSEKEKFFDFGMIGLGGGANASCTAAGDED